MIIVLYAVTALLYAGLSIATWRARHAPVAHAPAAERGGLLRAPAYGGTMASSSAAGGVAASSSKAVVAASVARGALLVALGAHGILLHATIFPASSMVFGFAFSLSAMLWLGVGIYWIESWFFPLEGLGMLVLPLACVASLMPAVFGGVRVLSYAADPLFKIHFLIANIAYGLLTIAALHAVLMLLAESRLHARRRATHRGRAGVIGAWLDALPPLLTLERLLFRLIGAGFLLLTLTLVSGVLFSEQLLDRMVSFDHKTVFAVLSWVMFGALLAGRAFYGWRGRAALRWVLLAFLALLLAYVGSRFVLEVLLHRQVV